MDGDLDLSKNIEIEKALKEFEEKSQTEQIQKNPEVLKNSETPRMIELVMKYSGGSVKNEKQAQYVLLGFVVIAIIVSLVLIFSGGSQKPKIIPQFREDIEPSVRAKLPPGVFETIPSKYDQIK